MAICVSISCASVFIISGALNVAFNAADVYAILLAQILSAACGIYALVRRRHAGYPALLVFMVVNGLCHALSATLALLAFGSYLKTILGANGFIGIALFALAIATQCSCTGVALLLALALADRPTRAAWLKALVFCIVLIVDKELWALLAKADWFAIAMTGSGLSFDPGAAADPGGGFSWSALGLAHLAALAIAVLALHMRTRRISLQ